MMFGLFFFQTSVFDSERRKKTLLLRASDFAASSFVKAFSKQVCVFTGRGWKVYKKCVFAKVKIKEHHLPAMKSEKLVI